MNLDSEDEHDASQILGNIQLQVNEVAPNKSKASETSVQAKPKSAIHVPRFLSEDYVEGFDSEFWFKEGFKMSQKAKMTAAIDYYKQGLKVNQKHAEIMFNLG